MIMGGCNFETISFGKDVKDAFHKACEEARNQYGNDSYNGTISTTEYKGMVQSTIGLGKRLNKKRINATIQYYIENNLINKWECKALELTGAELKRQKERYGMKGKQCKGFVFFGIASC